MDPNATEIYNASGLIGYYDSNFLAYDVNQNPLMINGQQALYDPSQQTFIDQSTAYGGGPVSNIVAYQGNTPPATSNANAILKTMTGAMYKYNAQGTNPVPYTPTGTGLFSGNTMLYAGLAAVAYVLLSGKSGGGSRRSRRR